MNEVAGRALKILRYYGASEQGGYRGNWPFIVQNAVHSPKQRLAGQRFRSLRTFMYTFHLQSIAEKLHVVPNWSYRIAESWIPNS
jgi:hypothetical protein